MVAQVFTALEHGSVFVWSARDDARRQHRPFWPWNRKPKSSRWVCRAAPPSNRRPADRAALLLTRSRPASMQVLVCRWVDTLREHSTSHPYRVVSEKGVVWMLPESK